MTHEEETYLIIKGTIADLPEEMKVKIFLFSKELEDRIIQEPLLGLAIALVGAKLATL